MKLVSDRSRFGRLIIAFSAVGLSLVAVIFVATDYFRAHSASDAGITDSVDTGSGVNEQASGAQLHSPEHRPNAMTHQPEQPSPSSKDTPEAIERLEILEGQIAELMDKSARADAERAAARAHLAELQDAANDPYIRQQFAKAIQLQKERQSNAVQDAFGIEEVDSSWAPQAAKRIEGNLATGDTFYSARLLNLECRTTMCRVDLAVPSTAGGSADDVQIGSSAARIDVELEILAALSKDMPAGSMRREPDGSGGYTYRIYVHRDGYTPPSAPNPMASMSIPEMRAYLDSL
ncbi:hypothetical protein [Thiocapsa marina]|uniref:Uncharacterized protein n=1 Tax=Thiocapsa marina 5811 TaxID=768671 RepID=F9UCH3_9GAMM|nr:hypothetical protein [Thiocapsa marina]EGV18086.1 hypothetical protein ThimaDRAFT_2625 [Thiocapsa marina 5811]